MTRRYRRNLSTDCPPTYSQAKVSYPQDYPHENSHRDALLLWAGIGNEVRIFYETRTIGENYHLSEPLGKSLP